MTSNKLSVQVVDPSGFSLPYDYCLCNALVEQGINVALYTTSEDDNYSLPRAKFTRYDHFYRRTSEWSLPEPVRTVGKGIEHVVDQLRFLSTTHPGVVHVQWTPVPTIDLFVLRKLKASTPVVYTAHNVVPHEPSQRDYRLRRWMYRSVDHIITHTEASKHDICSQFQIPAERVSVVPHGNFLYLTEHESDIKTLPSRVQSLIDQPTILILGLIREYKRLDRAIRALALVREEVPGASLLVVGQPRTDMMPYHDLIDKLDLNDAVTFVPEYIPDQEIASYFDISDVAVFPYDHVDQSGAALLAASMGMPIVATDIRGLAEVVNDGVNGRLVDGTPESLANALVSLFQNSHLRRSYGAASRERAETKFDWDRIATLTLEVYEWVSTNE